MAVSSLLWRCPSLLAWLPTLMTYTCAQHESPGLLCLPALVVPVAEPHIFQAIQGLPERAATDLRLQSKRALRLHNPNTIRVDLAVAPSCLYALEIHVTVSVSAHALPLLGPEAPLQVLDTGA